jgi:nitrite reductase/ring-hydroxylating ferredoxin subunit
MTTRRDFLKTTCGICVAFGGIGIAATLLEGCATLPIVKASPQNNTITVPVSAFGKSQYVLIRSAKMEFDILLVKNTDGTFHGLKMQCTHQAQPLSVSGNGLHCATHGSGFDLNGNVTQAPATQPLTRYFAAINGDSIIVQLNN